jgi:Na+-transporting methylmalonyl-CoA/oxaloacetate decarboxylase gamma subunit
MQTELFDQGLTLMLAGIGTDFAFLTTLVVEKTLMSKTLMRFQRELPGEDSNDEEIAAISAAIFKHRNN